MVQHTFRITAKAMRTASGEVAQIGGKILYDLGVTPQHSHFIPAGGKAPKLLLPREMKLIVDERRLDGQRFITRISNGQWQETKRCGPNGSDHISLQRGPGWLADALRGTRQTTGADGARVQKPVRFPALRARLLRRPPLRLGHDRPR